MLVLRRVSKKIVPFYLYITIGCLFLLVVYKAKVSNIKLSGLSYSEVDVAMAITEHNEIVNLFFKSRKDWPTSNLGSMLFKNTSKELFTKDNARKDKIYNVLIWKHWKWLENRHVFNYDKKRNNLKNLLNNCSVHNCIFSGEDSDLSKADAVVVHIQSGIFPKTANRNRKQRWVFLSDESPMHSFTMARIQPKFSNLANMFNWSMTYRSDSDIPVPYGRTVTLQGPLLSHVTYESLDQLVPYWKEKRRDVLATILISNCGESRRMSYLSELQKYLTVDVYGKCSKDHKDRCPGHFKSDCKVMSQYLFYLVFENSECREYLTEKGFYNAYSKGAIPVIMGPKRNECKNLLPPTSYLHVDDFKSPKDLAKQIILLSKDEEELMRLHSWRNNFKVANEHGYFGSKSYHYCRVCEGLNYNDKAEKIYDEKKLRSFLDPALLCR